MKKTHKLIDQKIVPQQLNSNNYKYSKFLVFCTHNRSKDYMFGLVVTRWCPSTSANPLFLELGFFL